MQEYDPPASSGSFCTKVLVKISIAVTRRLNRETNWKASYRLSPQMRDRYIRRETNGMARFPHPKTKIHFLIMEEKLLVESANLLEQITPYHHATARLPIDLPFRLAVPTHIFVRDKCAPEKAKWPKTKCGDQGAANRREWTRRPLKSPIRIQYFASKPAGFRMPIREFHPAVKRALMHDGVWIEDQNVVPNRRANAHVVRLRAPQVRTVFDELDCREVSAYPFDRPIRRAVVGDDHLKFCFRRAVENRAEAVLDDFQVIPANDHYRKFHNVHPIFVVCSNRQRFDFPNPPSACQVRLRLGKQIGEGSHRALRADTVGNVVFNWIFGSAAYADIMKSVTRHRLGIEHIPAIDD